MSQHVRHHACPRQRRLAVAAIAAGALVIGALATGEAAGLRINATASMPRGLWRVTSPDSIARGEIVTLCPPDSAAIREAARRGYIATGFCPGGYEPLVKPVAAVAGDLVTVTRQGIAVDGRPLAHTGQLIQDEVGRTLHPVPAGSYRVASGTVWLLSGHDPRSFDSRYFGPVPIANVTGVARPLWVLR